MFLFIFMSKHKFGQYQTNLYYDHFQLHVSYWAWIHALSETVISSSQVKASVFTARAAILEISLL